MNAYTCTNADSAPALTLEVLEQALQELLPVVRYRTSEFMPVVDADGEPMIMLFRPPSMSGFPDVEEYVILHPSNLPELQRQSLGKCRLVPMGQEP